MREQILKLLHKIPFQPFSVDVAADVAYSIPTPDHVLAAKNVLVIEDDGGLVDVIPYSHIRRISFASASQSTWVALSAKKHGHFACGCAVLTGQGKQIGFFWQNSQNLQEFDYTKVCDWNANLAILIQTQIKTKVFSRQFSVAHSQNIHLGAHLESVQHLVRF